jgi:hypothetical protein
LHYELIYDAATLSWITYVPPAAGLLFCALGAALVFTRVVNSGKHPPMERWALGCFSWAFLLFSICWTIAFSWLSISQYVQRRNASIQRDCIIVEGVITDHGQHQRGRRQWESFRLDGVEFQYQRNLYGPVRDGVMARACYVQPASASNNVVRLEIASD